jgi:hypothetical protein
VITDPRVADRILKHLESEASRARDRFEPRAPPPSHWQPVKVILNRGSAHQPRQTGSAPLGGSSCVPTACEMSHGTGIFQRGSFGNLLSPKKSRDRPRLAPLARACPEISLSKTSLQPFPPIPTSRIRR